MSNTGHDGFKIGQMAVATHARIGTEIRQGTPVRIVDVLARRRADTLYLVRSPGGYRVEMYGSSLAEVSK